MAAVESAILTHCCGRQQVGLCGERSFLRRVLESRLTYPQPPAKIDESGQQFARPG